MDGKNAVKMPVGKVDALLNVAHDGLNGRESFVDGLYKVRADFKSGVILMVEIFIKKMFAKTRTDLKGDTAAFFDRLSYGRTSMIELFNDPIFLRQNFMPNT